LQRGQYRTRNGQTPTPLLYLCSSPDRAPGYELGRRVFDSPQGYVRKLSADPASAAGRGSNRIAHSLSLGVMAAHLALTQKTLVRPQERQQPRYCTEWCGGWIVARHHSHSLGVMVARELPTLSAWVRFLQGLPTGCNISQVDGRAWNSEVAGSNPAIQTPRQG
jgi:hypothetical protein